MTLRQWLEIQGIIPGPSSHTSSTWPMVLRHENEEVVSQSVGYDIGSATGRVPREKTWDEIMEEVFFEYSDAWERLAKL